LPFKLYSGVIDKRQGDIEMNENPLINTLICVFFFLVLVYLSTYIRENGALKND